MISATETRQERVLKAEVTEDVLTLYLEDGRSVSAPIEWYPRLAHATAAERRNFRLIGRGAGIHWPDLDEDISVAGVLEGLPSQEGQESLRRWLEAYQAK